ncbi:hypothetical protein [Scytonema sp. PCC 10023]|uniref:hypothetical protein n=1 Tax=Scytonema sp. PCC 10023 TaxID=1680591 RepID=UPI0039C6F89B
MVNQNTELKATEVREDLFIELDELELKAVVGGSGPVNTLAGGVVNGVGEIGRSSGSTLDSAQGTLNNAINGLQGGLGVIGQSASDAERQIVSGIPV